MEDVEDFEFGKGVDQTDIEIQSDDKNDEGETDYFMDNLMSENNRGEVVSVPTVTRRSARLHKPKTCDSCAHVATVCKTQSMYVSVNVYEALRRPDAQKWTDAIMKELDNLKNKDVWDIVQKPLNRNVIDCKWMLVIKGDPDRYKARLVARRFWQRPDGVDYSETFSSIVKRRTLRILLALCAENEWAYEHIDVDVHILTFLWMRIYTWSNQNFLKFQEKTGLNMCANSKGASVYVDDILVFGTKDKIEVFKTRIKEKLDVRMLGTNTQFLSIHLSKPNSTTVVFDQSVQIGQMLDLFDIAHEVEVSTPLAKECEMKLVYQRTGQPLKVFCDSDLAGCTVDRKSRSGYVFILAGGAISWLSKKQPIIAQSTCEAEFVAMQEAARETVWISLLLRELDEVVAESSKHVQVRYFYVKNCVSKGILDYTYIPSPENVADILTKGLNRVRTQHFTKAMGLIESTIKGEC
uniref:uncharacterized protein LOC117161602 n=1 Tax=Bombus vancouverensis nearcticus TaxID=2705178 RepID=UPI001439C634|nr:uncharacterized protein LOC117161602 [Bombus vancouverensis nearcticus]